METFGIDKSSAVSGTCIKLALFSGTDKNGFGYGGTGKKSFNKQFDNYGTSFTLGDTIGCMLDLDSGTISFSKNGKHLGKAFDIPQTLKNTPLYPAVVLKVQKLLHLFHFSLFYVFPFIYVYAYKKCIVDLLYPSIFMFDVSMMEPVLNRICREGSLVPGDPGFHFYP